MGRKFTILIACLPVILLQCSSIESYRKYFRGEFRTAGSTDPVIEATTGDCDGDGWDDLVTWGFPQRGTTDVLILWSFKENRFTADRQWNVTDGRFTNCIIGDLEGDGEPEIVAARLDGERTWIEAYRAREARAIRRSPITTMPDNNDDPEWDGHFEVNALADIDGDGMQDIICSYRAGADLAPRGISLISGRSFEEMASYATAGPVFKTLVYEGESPSETVILMETSKTGNDVEIGPFSDRETYLIAVNANCELLWYVQTSEDWARWDFTLADLDSDGVPEVLVSSERHLGTEAREIRLESRDIINGEVKKFWPLIHNMDSIHIADFDRDTRPEIVAAFVDGTVQIFDASLEPTATYKGDEVIYIMAVDDVNLDGKPEIIARCANTRLVALDKDLKLIASRRYDSLIRLVGITRVGPNHNLLQVAVKGWSDLQQIKLAGRSYLVATLAIGAMVLIVGGMTLGVFMGARLPMRGVQRSDVANEEHEDIEEQRLRKELLIALAEFGHSGAARVNLGRLAQYAGAPLDPGDHRYPEYRKLLQGILEEYREFTRARLQDIIAICERLVGCEGHARRLARNMQEMERLLLSNSAGSGGTGAIHTANLGEELPRLALSNLAIIKEVSHLLMGSYETDVPAVVCRMAASSRKSIAAYGVDGIEIAICDGGMAYVDEAALWKSLECVIMNAAEAMIDSEQRLLSLEVSSEDSYILVRIGDTGCGIERGDWDRIFDHGYSTKGKGHGFGLYYAKQEIQRFRGSIGVETSEPGAGTVITMRLRASQGSLVKPEDAASQMRMAA